MTLSLITTASSFTSTSHRSGCIDVTNDQYLTVSSSNAFRKFSLATGAQVGSDITVTTSGQAVALITPASAVVLCNGASHDFIEISSGYRQVVNPGAAFNITGSFSPTSSNSTNQYQIAANDNAGNIMYLRAANSLVKLVSAGQTFSTLSPQEPAGASFTCIIHKGNSHFLVGDDFGRIIEIDTNGTLIRTLDVPLGGTYTNKPPGSTVGTGPIINTMAYEDDILTIGTSHGLFTMQYSTKQITKYMPVLGSGYRVLSNMVSGVCVEGSNTSNSSSQATTIREIDCTIEPLTVRSRLYQSQVFTITSQIAINPNTGRGVQVYSSLSGSNNLIAFFNIIPRSSQLRTILVQPGGQDALFRLIVIDDGGVGARNIIIDTQAQSPYTYRTPTGKDLVELISVSVGDGSNTPWAFGRYLT